MKHICAWCKTELSPPDGKDDHIISHGICPACKDKALKEMEEADDMSILNLDTHKPKI